LTVSEKFKVASEDTFDRGTFALARIFAGEAQLTNGNRSLARGQEARYPGSARYFGLIAE
jgi:hypothetical protein